MHLQRFETVHRIQTRHIEARDPHIHHDGNLEVRFLFFELQIEFLALFVGAQQVVQCRVVILLTDADQLDFLDGLDLFRFLFGQFFPIAADSYLRPFRPHGDNLFVDGETDLAGGADNHRLALDRTALLHAPFVVLHEIHCQTVNEVGTVEQDAHLRHRPLALLNLVFRRALLCALVVVGLNLLDELAVGNNTRRTAFVEDGLGDTVLHGFNHRILIHHRAKDIHRRIYGRARETHVGGVGQRVAEIFGKTIRAFHTCLRYL